ncbi:hypothetical protein E4T56_gene10113 [Termitomyces sp. T112]|nr:hypothetical protein E4T56_gene10113 [Termitomyces sp. T112]
MPLPSAALSQTREVAVEIDLVKVVGVAEWLEPKNKKEVQAFLGFASFYQRFIKDFLHHACPLFNLTAKDTAWSWGPLEQMAFDALKCSITSEPVLLFLDNNSPFQVEANSSDFATYYNSPWKTGSGIWWPFTQEIVLSPTLPIYFKFPSASCMIELLLPEVAFTKSLNQKTLHLHVFPWLVAL